MLPINFHRTFIPERRLIGSLLQYAALGKSGTYQEIAAETGIPMGKSTGKTPAMLDYARGMGLIELGEAETRGSKAPTLTALGQVVYLADRTLSEKLTQWVVHLSLCRGDIGASAWHLSFGAARQVLGSDYTELQLETYLSRIFGPGKDRTGPLLRTYTEDAALGRSTVLTVSRGTVTRRKAPLLDSFGPAYSALVLSLMESFFPAEGQLTLSAFGQCTLFFDTCLWNDDDIERLCALLDRKGWVAVDRHRRPWLLERRDTSERVWPHLFDDLA